MWCHSWTDRAARAEPDEREGHLRVPRRHTERITTGNDSQDQEEQDLKLGSWTSNQRGRATTLSPERKKQPSEIGMRWT
ncbi:helicase associated domain-containing protein [Streptomyces sp. NPDC002722]|uniref:helicase associated domain-containing protein n=1 Tax=unclassified Streptomyces TaxID=2593676 RepID=UPI00332513FA